MLVKINADSLVFKKQPMTELEKGVFEDFAFPPGVTVEYNDFTCIASGSKAELFSLLHDLSFKFDIELL